MSAEMVNDTIASPKSDMARLVRKTLDEASEDIPPYLFRIWTHKPGKYVEENSYARIVPLAFLDHELRDTESPTPNIDRVPVNHIKRLIDRHVETYEDIPTMFSTWSPSLKSVLNRWSYLFGGGPDNSVSAFKDAYISVIDTAKLPASNRIFYVPCLAPMYAKDDREIFYMNRGDYLLYGPVEGHHVSAPAPYMVGTGVELNDGEHRDDPLPREGSAASSEAEPKLLTIAEIERHRDCLAPIYGPELAVAVVAASLCVAKRDVDDWMSEGPDVEKFVQIMHEFDVPNTEGRFPGVSCDVDGMPDEHQAGILVRAFSSMRDEYSRKQRNLRARTEVAIGSASDSEHSSEATIATSHRSPMSASEDATDCGDQEQTDGTTNTKATSNVDESSTGESHTADEAHDKTATGAQKRSYSGRESSGSAEDDRSQYAGERK